MCIKIRPNTNALRVSYSDLMTSNSWSPFFFWVFKLLIKSSFVCPYIHFYIKKWLWGIFIQFHISSNEKLHLLAILFTSVLTAININGRILPFFLCKETKIIEFQKNTIFKMKSYHPIQQVECKKIKVDPSSVYLSKKSMLIMSVEDYKVLWMLHATFMFICHASSIHYC